MTTPPESKRVPVFDLRDAPQQAGPDGIVRRAARTQHAQLVFAEIPAGGGAVHALPQDYPHEIILCVMKGAMRVTVDGVDYAMPARSAIVVPAQAAHRGVVAGDEPVSVIEVYGPPRAEDGALVAYQRAEFEAKRMQWQETNGAAAAPRAGTAPLTVYRFDDIPRENRLFDGRMSRFGIRTRHAQVVFADIRPQPKAEQAFHRLPHDHPYDMMLVMLKGAMHVQMEGHDYDLAEGQMFVEPPFFMHRGYATGEDVACCLEVYAPPRTDYLNLVAYQAETFDGGDDAWIKPELDSWNPPRL